MKRCLISGAIGAVLMFFVLLSVSHIAAAGRNNETPKYEHEDFVSAIEKGQCFVCGSGNEYSFWGEDNIAILNLNTFEMYRLEINRYDEKGEQILEKSGVMTTGDIRSNFNRIVVFIK